MTYIGYIYYRIIGVSRDRVLQDTLAVPLRTWLALGYVHTVTFLHGFVLFHNPKGIPIYFQTIENDAKTLPCAHSLRLTSLHQ